jgi:hypothetical protein
LAQETRRRRRESASTAPPLQVIGPSTTVEAPKIPMPPQQPAAPPPPTPPIVPEAPPAAPDPSRAQVIISKRFCQLTGRPMVAICWKMVDPNATREYTVDVPMAEAIADQMYAVADDHRARYAPEWFETLPNLVPAG